MGGAEGKRKKFAYENEVTYLCDGLGDFMTRGNQ